MDSILSIIPSGDLHFIEIDPIADENPMMRQSEYNLLLNDIQKNGQKDPVLMFEGKIMDGRNRLKVAKYLNIDLKVVHLSGTREEAEASARSSDTRRNISKSQLAMKLARRVMASRFNSDGTPISIREWLSPDNLVEVKNKLIGARSVEKAIQMIKEYPDVAQSVFDGYCKMGKAQKIITAFKNEKETAEQKLQSVLEQQAYNASKYAPEALFIDHYESMIAEKYSSHAVSMYKSYTYNEQKYPRQKLAGLLVSAEQELQQYTNSQIDQTAKMRPELDHTISE